MTENTMFAENANAGDGSASYVDQLVGEGKPYKTVEDLAKAAVHKETHIKTLEGENANLRGEVSALKVVKTVEVPQTQVTEVKTDSAAPVIDLDKKIREVQAQMNQENVSKQHLSEVQERMIREFGDPDKAGAHIRAKAQELGVSPAFLQDTASQSPAAFYHLIGLNSAPAVSPAAPKSAVNTAGFTDTKSSDVKPNTYKWFVKTYGVKGCLSENVQNQMHRALFDAESKGQDFYA